MTGMFEVPGDRLVELSEAAGRLPEVMRIIRDWVTEYNDVGGIDAGDLVWRLEQAGHPLPDETA